MPVIMLLSDGRQTAGGTDQKAIDVATTIKDNGVKIFAFLFGDDEESPAILEQIASFPASSYVWGSLNMGINAVLSGITQVVDTLCTEVSYVCHVTAYCDEQITIVLHGRGFIDTNDVQCRAIINNGGSYSYARQTQGTVTVVDDETVQCLIVNNPGPEDGTTEASFTGARASGRGWHE